MILKSDWVGKRFERLIVIDVLKGKRQSELLCRCDCGNIVSLEPTVLRRSLTRSCGCLKNDLARIKFTTHGRSNWSPEYRTWQHMRDRCLNKSSADYPLYGGRGILICSRWDDFKLFFKDMGPRPSKFHSLDRFPDQSGNYSPENCRWATPKEQANNRRSNILITVDGKTRNIIGWSEVSGVPAYRISKRIRSGWGHKEAIFTLPRQIKKTKPLKL